MMVVSASTGPAASVVVNRFGYRATTMIGSLMSTTGFIISAFTCACACVHDIQCREVVKATAAEATEATEAAAGSE